MKAIVRGLLILPFFIFVGDVEASQLLVGRPDAKVKMLIYGDYECPFTVRLMKLMDPLMTEFGADLGISYSQFPLAFHVNAAEASRAGICAGDQGKLNEFSKIMFEQSTKLSSAVIDEAAVTAGVPDLAAFKLCRAASGTQTRVEGEIFSGQASGVTGTPNVYINGKLVQGAYPIEEFRRIIKAELGSPTP